jgi:H(+)-translocating pyrophosphatase
MVVAESSVTALVIICPIIGFAFSVWYTWEVSKVSLDSPNHEQAPLLKTEEQTLARVKHITEKIQIGAHAFLYREYMYLAIFMFIFFFVILIVVGLGAKDWYSGIFSAIAFLFGATTSILSGLLGMKIAVYANGRTAVKAAESIGEGFKVAFKAGIVMGFVLSSLGIIVLVIVIWLFKLHWGDAWEDQEATQRMYEAVAGYGLGGSSIALFGRVGGGIYTKAADVGADLVGKVEKDIPEDDPRNPATIADNVGDNVGDIAGMGADLFGSFAESTCAAMVIASQGGLYNSYSTMMFPLMISATGILVCMVTSFVASHIQTVRNLNGVEPVLKLQLLISTLLETPVIFLLSYYVLPDEFVVSGIVTRNWKVFICIACGLWSGLVIGYTTEYFTSNTYKPVIEVAESCKTGAATNIIYGLALGYKSVIIPVFCIAISIYVGFRLAGMFGIACAALGILSTMSIGLTIDAYGPISDNAGGIAEMAHMGEEVRARTDALDAAGNTTAAIGKGFAIGSAALVSLALFGGYVTVSKFENADISLQDPYVFAGLLVGAMLPYWFSALTMKSVGMAALAMVVEVRRQFNEIPGILSGENEPEYDKCIQISTDASLREMVAPGVLVMLTPIITGLLFGRRALAGLLAGSLVSGVQMAISASNTGGAWDNAKKYYEKLGLKGTPEHKAAVVGDTVGDPLKDTSGPSLNILIKLMAIISLVFAPAFPAANEDGYLIKLFTRS